MRVLAAIFVSLVAFVMIAGRRSDGETDFVRAVGLYGAQVVFHRAVVRPFVALAGASGVAGAGGRGLSTRI